MTKESQKPVAQMGMGVNAKMFQNQTKDGKQFDKVQIVRTYWSDGEFRSTSSFSIDELPQVIVYARRMYELGLERRIERARNDEKAVPAAETEKAPEPTEA